MKKILATALFSMFLPGAALAAAPVPQPRILVIDNNAILQFSKVGQDISRQIQAMSAQARKDLASRGNALQAEQATLQQQVAILSADVKAQKIKAFEAKQAALQADAAKREQMLQGGVNQARVAMQNALGPILQQILKERGANMLLDKQAVLFATDGSFDITADAINRLNQKMTAFKVQLAAPPAPKK